MFTSIVFFKHIGSQHNLKKIKYSSVCTGLIRFYVKYGIMTEELVIRGIRIEKAEAIQIHG